MSELLSTLAIVAYGIAGVCLALAVFFWFFFKIPSVIGDLTGRTARKSIAQMRAANEKAGASRSREHRSHRSHGEVPAAAPRGRGLSAAEASEARPETGLLSENRAEDFVPQGTTVLEENPTGPLIPEETTLLRQEDQTGRCRTGGKELTMIDEVMLVYTEEEIG